MATIPSLRQTHTYAELEISAAAYREIAEKLKAVTSRNRFVSRKEGRQLQDAAGIPSAAEGGYRGDSLYSEDLY